MITFLYDIQNNLITNLVLTAILNPDIIKVANRLLDGTYHTQTIGDKLNIIDVTCYVTKAKKLVIDNMYVTDEPIKLVKDGKYYIGLMAEKSKWEEFSKDLMMTSFKLMVQSEGLI